MQRIAVGVFFVAAFVAAFGSAHAASPIRDHYDFVYVDDSCSFPIEVHAEVDVLTEIFDDASGTPVGTLVRLLGSVNYTDLENGHSVVATINSTNLFDLTDGSDKIVGVLALIRDGHVVIARNVGIVVLDAAGQVTFQAGPQQEIDFCAIVQGS